jgi:ankyrin repeat protein
LTTVHKSATEQDENAVDPLYRQIFDSNYLKRYQACQLLLEKNGIPYEVSELRQVFPWIVAGTSGSGSPGSRERYQVAANNLQKYIRSYGSDPDYSSFGRHDLNEALLDACYYVVPDCTIIHDLIQYGADINAQDSNGYTAFMYASKHENYDVMKLFLEAGADINAPLPLPEGFSRDFYTTVFLDILKYTKPEYTNLLLDHGADVTIRDHRGNNCLHVYCDGAPETSVLRRLIDMGVSLDDINDDGNTVLHVLSFRTADTECISMILAAKAMVNAVNNQGRTPLHNLVTSYQGTKDEVELLISHGARVNIQDREGNTPLHLAVTRKNRECVQSLIDHGAGPDIKNSDGWNPYRYALSQGFIKIAEDIAGPRALVDYKKSPQYRKLQEIKRTIQESIRNGSIKEFQESGCRYRLLHDGSRFARCKLDIDSGDVLEKREIDEKELLRLLYENNMMSYSEEYSELDIFRNILDSLAGS